MTSEPGHGGDDASLAREAHAIHAALFGSSAPDDIVRDYVRAHDVLGLPALSAALLRAVENSGQLEALEYELRHRDPALSRKCRIVIYLAEARPAHYRLLGNSRDRRLHAWYALAVAAARAAVLRVKGAVLVRRVPVA